MFPKIRKTIISIFVFGLITLTSVFAQEKDSISSGSKSLDYILEARSQFNNQEFENVKITFKNFFLEVNDHPRQYPVDDWVDTCYQLAISIFRSGNYDLLAAVLDPIIGLEVQINENKYNEGLGKLVNILAMAYKNQGYQSESIPIYLKALEHFKVCENLPARTLPEFYFNLGNALRDLGDPGQAETYYSESLRLFDNEILNKSSDTSGLSYFLKRKATVLNSIGLNFRGLGKDIEALDIFSQSYSIRKIHDSRKLPMLDNNIGISLRTLGMRDSALYHFGKAVEAFDSPNSYDRNWFTFSLNYSDLLNNMGELDGAQHLVTKTINQGLGIDDVTNSQMATAYFQLGSIQSEKGDYESAIKNIDLGLSMLTGHTAETVNGNGLPIVNLDNSPGKVIEGIKFRARIIHDWGKTTKENSRYFDALENYLLAEICIDSLRVILEDEESKINLSRVAKETYAEKLDLLWKVMPYSSSKEIAPQAFETIEKGKAASLWNIIQLSEDKFQSLPMEIVNLEKSLQNEIAEIENKLLNLIPSDSFDPKTLMDLKFSKERQLDSLTNYINENFSEFKQQKFQNESFSASEIAGLLTQNQVMIQYFFSDTLLHQICLSRDSILFRAIPGADLIREQMVSFINMLKLSEYDYSNNDVEEYHALAWNLYNKLISPFQELITDKELIILPDEALSLIPFEALITSETLMPDWDFRDLKYFIKSNQISYSYNSSLWAYRKDIEEDNKRSVLAIAPNYGVKGMDTSKSWQRWEPFLPELPGTQEEVKLIGKYIQSDTYARAKATEKRFKGKASTYNILHMAMHSTVDEAEPDNSFLVFTPFADNTEDGKLYANEIRNLDLNAALTILSACNSGTGEMIAGEGVLSLSRTFLMAGSASVIMTLWSVDDQTSMELIEMLYNDMAFDMSVAEALRSAKLNFLSNAGKLSAHPFFWSGFIQLGRDTNIVIKKKNRRWLWFAGGIILAGIIILLSLKNTKPRS